MPTTPDTSDDFREQLSAWHDGALPDEASRFVLKRLMQDDALRAEVGRWQAVGDALRRQPQQRPASDLPERIAAAVMSRSSSSRGPALRWMASAAAVGMAAVLMWPSAPLPPSDEAVARVALTPVVSPSRVVTSSASRSLPAPSPLRVADASAAASLAVAVPPLVRAPQPTPEQLAPLPAVDAPGRPWPRSAPDAAAFTVDYRVPAPPPPRQ